MLITEQIFAVLSLVAALYAILHTVLFLETKQNTVQWIASMGFWTALAVVLCDVVWLLRLFG